MTGCSWYTGFADAAGQRIYFCVYLGKSTNSNVSGAKAREIAVKIVSDYLQKSSPDSIAFSMNGLRYRNFL